MAFTESLATAAKRFSSLPASIKAVSLFAIVGVGVLVFTQISPRGCVGRDLGEMDRRLGECGTVVVAGPDDLLDLDVVEGCRLVPVSRYAEVGRALDGRDEMALVHALRAAHVERILVGVDTTDPQLLPPLTMRHLLGTYHSLDHFHALYLSQAAGLFELVDPLRVSDAAGAQLVRIARAVLVGATPPAGSDLLDEVGRRRDPSIDVAVSVQGLQPIERDSRSANFNRRDLYIVRGGASLAEATIAAAERVRERWDPTGNQEREGDIAEAMERLTVEVEVLHDRSPIEVLRPKTLGPESYRRHLWNSVELGVHGLAGSIDDDQPRYLLPSSAVYRASADVNEFLERLARNIDLNGDGNENSNDEKLYSSAKNLNVDRFRTHHFREMEPEGDVRRLDRSFIPVDQDEVTPERVRETVRLAASWLVNNQRDDGLFEYKYFPTRDVYYREFHEDVEEAHNIVRHGLAAYSLVMAARELDDEAMWDAAEAAVQIMLDNTVIGPAWYEDDELRSQLPEGQRQTCRSNADCGLPRECVEAFCRLPFGAPAGSEGDAHRVAPGDSWESHDGYRRPIASDMMYVRWKDVGKMGAVAAVVMALTEMIAERPELLETYRPYLRGFYAFFRFMQKPDGSFNHYFTAPGDARYYSTETTIYPGEILFAMSRLYRLLQDEQIRTSFDSGLRHYAAWYRDEVGRTESDGTYSELRRNNLMAFVPWVSMAANDMYQQHRERQYSDIGIETSDWIAGRFQFTPERTYYQAYMGSYYRVWWEQAAMHGIVYTEGTAAAFNLARSAGDAERAERMRRSTLLGCRFAVQQVIRPGIDDHFFPGARAKMRSRGGVRFSLTASDIRTDYIYHSLSALVQTLRYLRSESEWAPPPMAGGGG
jgi:AMMECR1 domain-containing protein